jgi:preprotein translocase subunit SecG
LLFITWVVIHVIVSVGLILVVLMQSAKGEGMAGSMFGGGGGMSGAVFGGRGAASFLSKATTVLAVLFMLNCMGLAFLSARPVATAGGQTVEPGESAITRAAQAERERQLQQQATQPIPADTDAPPIRIVPQDGQDTAAFKITPVDGPPTPADTGR